MTIVVGGKRARLISDNFYELVRSGLDALDWFDSGRQHHAITMMRGQPEWDDPVAFNTVAIADINVGDVSAEVGSNLTEDTWAMFVDFYAENDSVGAHLIGDVRDILRGKMPSIGRSTAFFTIYDFSQTSDPDTDTGPALFEVEIQNVHLDRAYNQARPWMKHWFSVRADLIDYYGDEYDA